MYSNIISIFTKPLFIELFFSVGMIAAIFIALWAIAFYKLSSKIWTLIFVLILSAFAIAYGQLFTLNVIAWLIFIPIALFVNLPRLRASIFTVKIMKKIRKKMPKISDTEQKALAAGDLGWEKEIFCGDPKWDKLFSLPQSELSAEEQLFIDNQVEELCALIHDWELYESPHELPQEVWNFIKKEKFFGIIIDKKYGGLGFSSFAHSTIITKIATRSYSAAVTVMVPNSLGPAEFLQHYGTEEQKNYYLPRLAKGEEIPCFALTAPSAGSDAASIRDTGVICEDMFEGKLAIGLRLNWEKRYITLAPLATLMGVAVKVSDPDHFLGDQEELGISFCLVPSHLPGVETGARHLPMNMAFMNGPTSGKDVFIPLDHIIGGPMRIGQGWEMIMNSLAIGRGISLPAVSCAAAKLSLLTSGAYSRVREQFQLPLCEFEGIQEALARIGGYTYLCEATRLFTVGIIDSGIHSAVATAITKYHLTEFNRKIINDAMDIHAGKALMLGKRNYLAQLYIGAPIGITVEGANILTRNLIIFGQGALRCHPYVAKEIAAMNNNNEIDAIIEFDQLIFKHLGYLINNMVRSLTYGFTGTCLISLKENGFLKTYLKQITRYSRVYAMVVDLVMLSIGGDLKRRELLSARLGDMLSYLYMASAVVKYFQDAGRNPADEPFVEWSIKTCLYEYQQSLQTLLNNLPHKGLAWLIRFMSFPFGFSAAQPLDKTAKNIAKILTTESDLRSRLTQYCYVGKKNEDAVAALEYVFQRTLSAEKIQKKLQKTFKEGTIEQLELALESGLITQNERNQMRDLYLLREDIIQVDTLLPWKGHNEKSET